MKKSKFLMALACVCLLATACGGKTESGSKSKVASSSAEQSSQSSSESSSSSSSESSGSSDASSSSSSQAPSQQSGEEGGESYYSWPFGFEGKWDKGAEYKWTFAVAEDHEEMTFAFGAQMTSSTHGDRSLYINSSIGGSDSYENNAENNGKQRITITANGEPLAVTRQTYGEANLNTSSYVYYKVAKFGCQAGNVEIVMKTSADAGFRLNLGGEARLYYPKAEPAEPSGYNVTFNATNCKVYAYEVQTNTGDGVTPTEVTGPVQTRTSGGTISKYVIPTAINADDDIKPQINFKVVPDEGYKVNLDCFTISGAKGLEWNDLKQQSNDIYRITKIKADITVNVVCVEGEKDMSELAYEVTFVCTNCTVTVYLGETSGDVDPGPKFYTRDKDDPTKYALGDNARIFYAVTPVSGYQFDDEMGDATQKGCADISYISPADESTGYKNIKKTADNRYYLTKMKGNVTITLTCTSISA